MKANAYRCFGCGAVVSAADIENGAGQWIEVAPMSLCLVIGNRVMDGGPEPFCGPDCLIATMQKVKRVESA